MGFDTPSAAGAPTDAEYVTNSSDPDLSNEVVKNPASEILLGGSIGTTSSISPGFENWTQVDANNPSLLYLLLQAETNGGGDANITLEVDESGGTTADYTLFACTAAQELGSAARAKANVLYPLQAGAQFRVVNGFDPNGNNSIVIARTLTLDPDP